MNPSEFVQFITLNGFKYAVQQGTYNMKWERQFTATLVANIAEINFVDKGPGIQTYDMTLTVYSWPTTSQMYQNGITQTFYQQMTNLFQDYGEVATSLSFTDPFGLSPQLGGVYFTDIQVSFPEFSTPGNPCAYVTIEVIASNPAI
jgi:hypothetical protein